MRARGRGSLRRIAVVTIALLVAAACGGQEALPEREPSNVVLVPDLGGMERESAASLVTARGLKPVIQSKRFPEVQPGLVMNQDPPARTEVAKGSVVTITVAKH